MPSVGLLVTLAALLLSAEGAGLVAVLLLVHLPAASDNLGAGLSVLWANSIPLLVIAGLAVHVRRRVKAWRTARTAKCD